MESRKDVFYVSGRDKMQKSAVRLIERINIFYWGFFERLEEEILRFLDLFGLGQ